MAKKSRKNRTQSATKPTAQSSTVVTTPKWPAIPAPVVDHLPTIDEVVLPGEDSHPVLLRVLRKALTMRRDHGSVTEAEFTAWLSQQMTVTMIDGAGNLHVDLRTKPTHCTMFTAHTDSVHNGGGTNRVRVDDNGKRVMLRADGAALGADDGSGVALLCHMIASGVPGYYVFFRGEECGGIGSSWLAENMPALFDGIHRAVAFDRAGYSDVITHQSGGRCCSDLFANALSDALTMAGQLYMPCDRGVYTDTAEFTHLVSECTNISVGYKSQHGDREEQDLSFLLTLADSVVQVAWDDLPAERQPGRGFGKYTRSTTSARWFDDDLDDAEPTSLSAYYAELERMAEGELKASLCPQTQPPKNSDEAELLDFLYDALDSNSYSGLLAYVAELVWPDDPGLARNSMSGWRLDDDAIQEHIVAIESGASASEVACAIYDTCSIH